MKTFFYELLCPGFLVQINLYFTPFPRISKKYYQKYICVVQAQETTPPDNKLKQIKSSPEPWGSSIEKSKREEKIKK